MNPAATTTVPTTFIASQAPIAFRTPPAARADAPHRPIPAPRLVTALDIGLLFGALTLAIAARSGDHWLTRFTELLAARVHAYDTALIIALAAAGAVIFDRAGLYDAARLRRWADESRRLLVATTAFTGTAAGLIAISHPGLIDTATMARFWTGAIVAVGTARAIRYRLARSIAGARRVLIVGSGPHARRIFRSLSVDQTTRYQVLGFVDTNGAPASPFMTRRTLGGLEALESILSREHVDEVHVGLPVKSHYPQIQETIRVCERIGVKVMYGTDIFGTELARPHADRGGAPRVELVVVAEGWRVAVKRLVDIAGAAAAIVALSPLMIAVAVAIKLTSEGPIIFAQERYGLNRRRFRMLKFRTMVPNAEKLQASLESMNEAQGPVFKIANDPRITPLGRWLRRTSLDELPQLFNVLFGEMSLIGPRPLPLRDVMQFTRSADLRRFSVRPGITGLWQVSGRSGLGFDQWITLDLHYIDNWSLTMDAVILARTVPAVLRGTGAA
jgi:exopolysaccharide biosynthesis polyprenyl glycosylphosphotransferase